MPNTLKLDENWGCWLTDYCEVENGDECDEFAASDYFESFECDVDKSQFEYYKYGSPD